MGEALSRESVRAKSQFKNHVPSIMMRFHCSYIPNILWTLPILCVHNHEVSCFSLVPAHSSVCACHRTRMRATPLAFFRSEWHTRKHAHTTRGEVAEEGKNVVWYENKGNRQRAPLLDFSESCVCSTKQAIYVMHIDTTESEWGLRRECV